MRTWILAGILLAASSGAALAQDAAAGEKVFKTQPCFVCHSIGEGATVKLGPPLNGLDGRKAASFPNFNYSPATRGAGITWNEENFKKFIADPQGTIPGTTMGFAGIKTPQDVSDLWAYVKQFDADGKAKK